MLFGSERWTKDSAIEIVQEDRSEIKDTTGQMIPRNV